VGDEFIVVDFNPEIIKMLLDEGISCIYGDIGDIEILDRVGLQNARLVISTIPEEEENSLLIQKTKEINPKAMVFVTADTVDQALQLYDLGADYVILPRNLSGEKISELIEEYAKKPRKIEEITAEHIKNLERMKAEEILNKYEPSFLKSLEQKFNGHHKR